MHLVFFPFSIGMQFSQAVCIMQSQVATMKKVQVIYNENVNIINFIVKYLMLSSVLSRYLFQRIRWPQISY